MSARLAAVVFVVALSALGAAGCGLPRPETVPTRMIEPRLDPPAPQADEATAIPVRLLVTQARGHLGSPLLRQLPGGELTVDAVWRWTSAPDFYLDSAVRLAAASNPRVRIVDAAAATTLGLTLVVWHLETSSAPQLVGVVEVEVTGSDRSVRLEVIRATEAVSSDLPGNLADAAGRLLTRLATDSLSRITSPRP